MRERDETLRRRAERLAARASITGAATASDADESGVIDVVIVHVGRERWAFASGVVREVVAHPVLTPLPGLPPHLPGLCSVRGDLVGVVDPRPTPGPGRDAFLVVVEHPRGPVGVLVDGVAGFERRRATARGASADGASPALIVVADDGVQVMDGCRLVEHLAAAGVAPPIGRLP